MVIYTKYTNLFSPLFVSALEEVTHPNSRQDTNMMENICSSAPNSLWCFTLFPLSPFLSFFKTICCRGLIRKKNDHKTMINFFLKQKYQKIRQLWLLKNHKCKISKKNLMTSFQSNFRKLLWHTKCYIFFLKSFWII